MRVKMSLEQSPVRYLSAGRQYKVYPVHEEAAASEVGITDDTGERIFLNLKNCEHLGGAPWIVIPTEPGVKNEHELKVWPIYFQEIWDGLRAFEIRFNGNKNFRPGDLVLLNEYVRRAGVFTGRQLVKRVSCVTAFEQKPGYVVFGIMDCEEYERRKSEQSKSYLDDEER